MYQKVRIHHSFKEYLLLWQGQICLICVIINIEIKETKSNQIISDKDRTRTNEEAEIPRVEVIEKARFFQELERRR